MLPFYAHPDEGADVPVTQKTELSDEEKLRRWEAYKATCRSLPPEEAAKTDYYRDRVRLSGGRA